MKIGLYDVDGHNFPNIALMKLSAWHKKQGDDVEMFFPMKRYDKVYVSKIFGDEYSQLSPFQINAEEVVFGGTGFAITIENNKEVYYKDRDLALPNEVEHIYPDYSLYPTLTDGIAYGFLTRGCCNNCSFCIVSKKEGRCSKKVADLTEFWSGQREVKLLDANLLACKDHAELLQQLIDSKAKVDFTQGLDARFITKDNIRLLSQIKTKMVHFAFDFMENKDAIIKGLDLYRQYCGADDRKTTVYILTNFNTTFQDDWYRVQTIREMGLKPYVMIYRKPSAPKLTRFLQEWCNGIKTYRACDFFCWKPRKDGKTIKEIFGKEIQNEND